jgi:hypothetical protein
MTDPQATMLDISVDAFVEIWSKLEALDAGLQLHEEGTTFVLDMQGVALRAEAPPPDDPATGVSHAPLPDHVLERIAWYAKQASQPPIHVIQVPEDVDQAHWCEDALFATAGQPVYGVSVGTQAEIETRGACVTAITGNGLQSHANANFYTLCHTAVPMLIAEIRRLRAAQEHPE